jgi:hypothetical protein
MKGVPFIIGAALLAGCTSKHIAYHAGDTRLTPQRRADSIPIWLPRTVLDFKCTGVVKTTEPSLLYREATNDAVAMFVGPDGALLDLSTIRGNTDPGLIELMSKDVGGAAVTRSEEEPDGKGGERPKVAREVPAPATKPQSTVAGVSLSLASVEQRVKFYQDVALGLGVELKTNGTSTTYSFKEPSLTARGERDPEAFYYVRLDKGLFSKIEFSGQFATDGTVGAVSSSAENKGFEFAMKSIEVAAGIAGKVVGLKPFSALEMRKLDAPQSQPLIFQVLGALKNLQTARQDLVSGSSTSAPRDEKVLARMLEELDKIEQSLLSFFTGASSVKMFPIAASVRPTTNYNERFPLVRFDKAKGFAPAELPPEVQLSPIPPELQAKDGASQLLVLKLSNQSPGDLVMWSQLAKASSAERGLPFRVPARSTGRIVLVDAQNNEVRTVMAADALIAQWGQLAQLPSTMGSPGSAFKPTYYSDTGSLKELAVSGTALSPDALSSLNTATGSITDALNAKADREAAAAKDKAAKTDELNQLRREGDLLEQRVRIQGLLEKLPSDDDGTSP